MRSNLATSLWQRFGKHAGIAWWIRGCTRGGSQIYSGCFSYNAFPLYFFYLGVRPTVVHLDEKWQRCCRLVWPLLHWFLHYHYVVHFCELGRTRGNSKTMWICRAKTSVLSWMNSWKAPSHLPFRGKFRVFWLSIKNFLRCRRWKICLFSGGWGQTIMIKVIPLPFLTKK